MAIYTIIQLYLLEYNNTQLVMICVIHAVVYLACRNFTIKPLAIREALQPILLLFSRYALWIYVGHLLLFIFLEASIFPERYTVFAWR